MRILKFAVILIFISLIFGCGSSDKIIGKYKFQKGEFSYLLNDSAGSQLANGNLKVDYLKDEDLSGSYTVISDSTVNFDGKETFKGGTFIGHFNDSLSIVWLNMNPKVADANIFIIATDYTDSLKGGWFFSTFRGKKSGGLFTAKRLK
jgi:hypothetical protein